MPHCIIEYSSNVTEHLAPAELVKAVHDRISQSGLFTLSHIKTRAIEYPHYQLGDSNAGFIHITIRLHQGRSASQKKTLLQSVITCLAKIFPTEIALTAEIIDIDTATYVKHPV